MKLIRQNLPYDSIFAKGVTTSSATVQNIWEAMRDAYKELNMTECLYELKELIIGYEKSG